MIRHRALLAALALVSGLVQRAIERAGGHGMEGAPRQEPPVVTGTVPGVPR
jgi:hypothetical protein